MMYLASCVIFSPRLSTDVCLGIGGVLWRYVAGLGDARLEPLAALVFCPRRVRRNCVDYKRSLDQVLCERIVQGIT